MIKIVSKWLIFISIVCFIGCGSGSNNQSDITQNNDNKEDTLPINGSIVSLSPEHLYYYIVSTKELSTRGTLSNDHWQPVDILLEKYFKKTDGLSIDVHMDCYKNQCDDGSLLKTLVININTPEDTFRFYIYYDVIYNFNTNRTYYGRSYDKTVEYNSEFVSKPAACVLGNSFCSTLHLETVSCDYLNNDERYSYLGPDVWVERNTTNSSIGYYADCSVGGNYLVGRFSFWIFNSVIPNLLSSVLKGEFVIANSSVLCRSSFCYYDIDPPGF